MAFSSTIHLNPFAQIAKRTIKKLPFKLLGAEIPSIRLNDAHAYWNQWRFDRQFGANFGIWKSRRQVIIWVACKFDHANTFASGSWFKTPLKLRGQLAAFNQSSCQSLVFANCFCIIIKNWLIIATISQMVCLFESNVMFNYNGCFSHTCQQLCMLYANIWWFIELLAWFSDFCWAGIWTQTQRIQMARVFVWLSDLHRSLWLFERLICFAFKRACELTSCNIWFPCIQPKNSMRAICISFHVGYGWSFEQAVIM